MEEKKINLDLYKKALEKLEELEKIKADKIAVINEEYSPQIDSLNNFIAEQNELIDLTFSEEAIPEEFEISNDISRVKLISNSVNTSKVIETFQEILEQKIGKDKASEIINAGLDAGKTVRESFNRTNYFKGAKAHAKENNLDIKEIIAAAEEENTEKTIRFETKFLSE